MLVDASGALLGGSVGGGAMEGRVLALAREAILDGQPRTGSYRLADPDEGDPGVCGGTVDILIEPLLSPHVLVVIGAGHVGRALVTLGAYAGFRVILSDDRAPLCDPALAPGAHEYRPGDATEMLAGLTLTANTYVALVTRGYPLDVPVLPKLLASPVAYIGVIGSKRRWLTTVEALKTAGVADADLVRVHAPIGLEIGAETPEEIAVAIMAEIIATRRAAAR